MSTKLFVGNLPYETTDQDLREFFSQAGTVESAQVIINKMTNQSRGFGFVEMDDEGAQKAIQELNGKELGGRALTINAARPMTDRPPRRGGFRGGRGFGNEGGSEY